MNKRYFVNLFSGLFHDLNYATEQCNIDDIKEDDNHYRSTVEPTGLRLCKFCAKRKAIEEAT